MREIVNLQTVAFLVVMYICISIGQGPRFNQESNFNFEPFQSSFTDSGLEKKETSTLVQKVKTVTTIRQITSTANGDDPNLANDMSDCQEDKLSKVLPNVNDGSTKESGYPSFSGFTDLPGAKKIFKKTLKKLLSSSPIHSSLKHQTAPHHPGHNIGKSLISNYHNLPIAAGLSQVPKETVFFHELSPVLKSTIGIVGFIDDATEFGNKVFGIEILDSKCSEHRTNVDEENAAGMVDFPGTAQ